MEKGEVYINEDKNAIPSIGISNNALYLNSCLVYTWNAVPKININVHKIIALIKLALL